jgi:endonuclease-3
MSQAPDALDVHGLLVQEYGDPAWAPRADPLAELIGVILSQNTSDLNSARAYASLRAAFPTWEQVRDAPVQAVAAAIHSGGLAAIKAPRIQRVLATISDRRGRLDLGFLADLPVDEARRWLMSLDGVGAKTAACVLLFALGQPVVPVDTHVHRVSLRLGLVSTKHTPEQTEGILESLLPPWARYAYHMNVIAHGRLVCKAQRPRCGLCVLTSCCAYWEARPGQSVPPAAESGEGAEAS